MALPPSGQDGDIAVNNGVWHQYKSDRDIWQPLDPGYQRYFNQNGFTGVSGSGVNQVFYYEDADGFTSSMSQGEMFASIPAIEDLPTGLPEDRSPQGQVQGQRIADAYRTWLNQPGAKWPPMKDDITSPILRDGELIGYNTIQDTEAIKQFLAYAKMNDLKFTDSPLTGADGTPQAVTIGGQQYFQQPDGDYERIPEAEAAEVRGEGKYEYDQNLGRWVIRQPDGSIQFGPEATQDAKIEVDSDGRRYITQPDGSIQYLGREFEPGVISRGGYNLLQQPSGALSQLAPLPEPAGIETIGGMQFIKTSTGELMPLDNVMNRMMENMVVTGDLEGAAAIHAWQTRPSNQEYFDRALAYMRSPADQLVISAIARGQGLVSPPPEETIQRIGPQPDYLTEAFNMLQDQMQMGMPEGTQTFADTLAERAQAIELEAAELALERQREENKQFVTSNELNNEAAAIANEGASIANQAAVITANDNHTSEVLNQEAADINNSIAASGTAFSASIGGEDPQEIKDPSRLQAKKYTDLVQQWVDYFGEDDRGRLFSAIGGLTQGEAIDWMKTSGNWELTGLTPVDPNVPHPEFDADGNPISVDPSGEPPEVVAPPDSRGFPSPEEVLETTGEESDAAFQAAVDKYGDLFTPGGNVTTLGTTAYDPDPVWSAPEEADDVAPLTFEQAVESIQSESPGSASTVFTQPEPEPVVAPAPAPTYAPPEEADPAVAAPAMTTEQALASFGVPSSQMGSYAGTSSSPAMSTNVWDTSNEDDWFAGGGVYDDNTAIVGESGPELAIFPRGTEIVPLDRKMKPDQARRLRNRGIRGMQEGGIVFDSPLPLGIRQLQAGRSLGAPRGQLLRTAGIALPSAQARRRMLPGEREAFGELGRLAGIPEAEFQQELAITDPSGAPRTTNARMLPLSLRR